MTIKIRQNYNRDNSRFGGVIYDSDFYTYFVEHHIPERIAKDAQFDRQCRYNAYNRDKIKKQMTKGSKNNVV